MKYDEPFFIVGCVRSGTTLLRNILREHSHLICPEETHFFHWAEPFGTPKFINAVTNGPVLQKHRKLDGISEEEFQKLLMSSISKADLYSNYMRLFSIRHSQTGKRWFDKTPQNIFCGALLFSQFPDSKLIHIVRNPLDVVCSLRIGKVMKMDSLVGACNYWLESVQSLDTLKKADTSRVFEMRYEDFVVDTQLYLNRLMSFLGEEFRDEMLADITIKASHHVDHECLTKDEIALVKEICGEWGRVYGYSI